MKKVLSKNNKGFTLVELIVVIAIITIISVIVAPKFIDYVEKARIGTDENAIYEVAHAAETAYVGIEDKDDNVLNVYIKSKGDATYVDSQIAGVSTGSGKTLAVSVDKILDDASYKYKSKTYRNRTVTITIDKTTGKASVDLPTDENEDYIGKTYKYEVETWWGGTKEVEFNPESSINSILNIASKFNKDIPKELSPEQKEELNQKIYEAELKGETVKDVTVDFLANTLGIDEKYINMFIK